MNTLEMGGCQTITLYRMTKSEKKSKKAKSYAGNPEEQGTNILKVLIEGPRMSLGKIIQNILSRNKVINLSCLVTTHRKHAPYHHPSFIKVLDEGQLSILAGKHLLDISSVMGQVSLEGLQWKGQGGWLIAASIENGWRGWRLLEGAGGRETEWEGEVIESLGLKMGRRLKEVYYPRREPFLEAQTSGMVCKWMIWLQINGKHAF